LAARSLLSWRGAGQAGNDKTDLCSLSLTKLDAQSTTEKPGSIAVGTETAKAGVLLNTLYA
jgi:hypothetical protein